MRTFVSTDLMVGRYRDQSAWVHKPFPLRHILAVNEFLLKVQLLETEQTPEVQGTILRYLVWYSAGTLDRHVQLPTLSATHQKQYKDRRNRDLRSSHRNTDR
jgi:hypothetical protein